MTLKRVTIVVTHLLGTGHLSRSLTIARALASKGLAPQVVSGGMPTNHFDLSGIDFVQLPSVRSDGVTFTRLLDQRDDPVSPELMQERIDLIERTLRQSPPDALVTELFPFGRRVLREEFLAALSVARQLEQPPIVLSSIRDILAPPSNEKKARQAEAWLSEYYDAVFVHSDADVAPLEASWPVTPGIRRMLRYTGFIAPTMPISLPGDVYGAGEVIVTAGGGSVGRKLFDTAIEASRLGDHRWRLLVGGSDAQYLCEKLNQSAQNAPLVAEPLRADYRAMLTRCAAAVGQCGYNTAIDWLQTGVPGVFVPFSEAGETEQTLRAASLQQRYGYGLIAEHELTAQNLAAEVDAAVRRPRIATEKPNFDGAAETARMLIQMLEARG